MRLKNGKQIIVYAVVALFMVLSLLLPHKDPNAVSFEARLTIPSIGVDAAIESLGLTPSGAMDAPDGPENVGWYSLGVRPGQEGSAVIVGHRGWKNDQQAVFDDLNKLKEGDIVKVTDSDGVILSFIVRETRTYGKDDVVPEVFMSESGMHLNLITCTGLWNEKLQSSEERLVVFTDLLL